VQERFDRALDLSVTGARVPEKGAVMANEPITSRISSSAMSQGAPRERDEPSSPVR
jgi:hypothetical protein